MLSVIFITECESVLGVLGNGFTGLVNCIECVKNKKFCVIDCILPGLALSRICLIWITVTDGFLKKFSPDMYVSSDLTEYISCLWIIIGQSSIWFANLRISYFLKIASFSQRLFLWLKGGLNRVLPLVMGSLLLSQLLAFPQVVTIFMIRISKRNRTWQLNMNKSEVFMSQVSLNLGHFPLTLSLITCFLLISSLWGHNRRMNECHRSRDPSTEAHIRAMKVLMSFLVVFILHFIGIAIEISCLTVPENKLLLLFVMAKTIIYPWGHSFILILGNNQLNQASLKALQPLKCFKKRQKSWHSMDRLGEK
ncbi:LOW QUALITY PROTEIN: taste receptor type 2 member 10 [Trichechus inunguis]